MRLPSTDVHSSDLCSGWIVVPFPSSYPAYDTLLSTYTNWSSRISP
ncbi:hypothetical protein [Streptomyces sp. NPDC057301]